jgi:hypothetical protein
VLEQSARRDNGISNGHLDIGPASRCCRCVGSTSVPPGLPAPRAGCCPDYTLGRPTVWWCAAHAGRARCPVRSAVPRWALLPKAVVGPGHCAHHTVPGEMVGARPPVCPYAVSRWLMATPGDSVAPQALAYCANAVAVVQCPLWGGGRVSTSAHAPDLLEITKAALDRLIHTVCYTH